MASRIEKRMTKHPLGIVVKVTGKIARLWTIPGSIFCDGEIEINFEGKEIPLSLGLWVYLRKDSSGQFQYKVPSDTFSPPLDAIVSVKGEIELRGLVLLGSKNEDDVNEYNRLNAWSPDLGNVGGYFSFNNSAPGVYEISMKRRKNSSTQTSFSFIVSPNNPVEQICIFERNTEAVPLKDSVVIHTAIVVEELKHHFVTWSRTNGVAYTSKSLGEIRLGDWIQYKDQMHGYGAHPSTLSDYKKIGRPLITSCSGGVVAVRLDEIMKNKKRNIVSAHLLGRLRGIGSWAVWDGSRWKVEASHTLSTNPIKKTVLHDVNGNLRLLKNTELISKMEILSIYDSDRPNHRAEVSKYYSENEWSKKSPISDAENVARENDEKITGIILHSNYVGFNRLAVCSLDGQKIALLRTLAYTNGSPVQLGDWVSVMASKRDHSSRYITTSMPEKLQKAPLLVRLGSNGEPEVQTIVVDVKNGILNRVAVSEVLGNVKDEYDVLPIRQGSRFLVWCRRIEPALDKCFWSLAKGSPVVEVPGVSGFSGCKLGLTS